jgi:tRNA A-37 threonylcarbamoyl transferase component Bud32
MHTNALPLGPSAHTAAANAAAAAAAAAAHQAAGGASLFAVPTTPAVSARDISEYYTLNETDEKGKGAFSRVVTGVHRATGKLRAVKIMELAQISADKKVMTMLAHEKEILRRVNHRNVIKLHDCITTSTRIYMAMDLMATDLFEFTVAQRRRLNEYETARVMYQLLDAVAYLHSISVVHRDIKLENILVNSLDDVRLADFGLAKILRDPPGAAIKNTPCGTSFYIAPEVIRAIDSGYGGVTAMVTTREEVKLIDLWSLGAVMFVLMSGRPPFSGQVRTTAERRALLDKIDRGVLFPDAQWAEVSMEAKHLCQQLLTQTHEHRITADQALRHPFFQVLTRPAPPPSVPRPATTTAAAPAAPAPAQPQQPPVAYPQQQQPQMRGPPVPAVPAGYAPPGPGGYAHPVGAPQLPHHVPTGGVASPVGPVPTVRVGGPTAPVGAAAAAAGGAAMPSIAIGVTAQQLQQQRQVQVQVGVAGSPTASIGSGRTGSGSAAGGGSGAMLVGAGGSGVASGAAGPAIRIGGVAPGQIPPSQIVAPAGSLPASSSPTAAEDPAAIAAAMAQLQMQAREEDDEEEARDGGAARPAMVTVSAQAEKPGGGMRRPPPARPKAS